MPVVFVHGVNTRDTDPDYATGLVARDDLLQRRVLVPLAQLGERFGGMRIVNAYWGRHGVEFAWKLASLPQVSVVEHLGADDDPSEADAIFTEGARALAGDSVDETSDVESLGADDPIRSDELLLRAAQRDLERFLELVLTPVLLSEYRITDVTESTPEREGAARALLAIACADVSRDPAVRYATEVAQSADELMPVLSDAVARRFRELARRELAPEPEDEADDDVEALGRAQWLEELADRARELFARVSGAPGRVVSVPLLQFRRERFNARLTRFLGDVFVYLNERGDVRVPGPIVTAVRDAIANAPRAHDDEPLILITHSMGGNILYDILTHYHPTLVVDAWISVGGQIGVFEEMKLFHASDKALRSPHKVKGLKPRVRYWLNVYDPADALGFAVAPVFADVDADLPYLTGSSTLKSHGEYFGRASFYDLILKHLQSALGKHADTNAASHLSPSATEPAPETSRK